MTRREFLIYGSITVGSAVATTVVNRLFSPTPDSISERLAAKEKEWHEKHKRAANLLFGAYEEYINVDTARDFYNYARGLVEAGQFSSYKEDVYGLVNPWVIDNPMRTPGLPNEIAIVVNYPEGREIGGSLYVRALSDQNVTTAQRPFVALYIDQGSKVIRRAEDYKNMQPLNEQDFARIWPLIFRDAPPTYATREAKYTRGHLEAFSEHNPRNGESVNYSIFSNGWVRAFVK